MLSLRPYQTRSVDFLLPRQRGFIVAPAGSGKTLIAASAAKAVAQPFDRVGWLCNTKEQCEQAHDAAKKIDWSATVTLVVRCVAGRPDVSEFDILIIDECHHLPAMTWTETALGAKGIVWGFSATPWSGDWERDGVLKAFFGEENFLVIDRKEVIAGGSITQGVVYVHHVDREGEFNDQIDYIAAKETAIRCKRYPMISRFEHERRCRWQTTVEFIKSNQNRNQRIADLANQSNAATLILVSAIEHGEYLAKYITDSFLVHAKIGKKKRTQAIDDFRTGKLRVMLATSLADEGLDVPRASVLILASGGRSAGKLEQRAGRVMRPHEGKEFGTVHDFSDAGASLAHNQFKARARTYKKLGYKIHDYS